LDTLAKETLSEIITYEEIIASLNQMHPYKAPGSDDFQGIFFKQYWHLIGKDVSDLITQAFVTGKFDDSLAHTLIVLIPKVEQPSNFKEFLPISLCNTIYKLITKVLVNRIRPMLDQIIGPFQSSFLLGRRTRDNTIILQEMIHTMRK